MNILNVKIPSEVLYIIGKLEEVGYEAYMVGGCVRDAVLGTEPGDWDICTIALPEQIIKCFEEHRTIKTGMKHGTITLVLEENNFEITTYRVDGIYSDSRRPDTVEFVSDLKKDLLRRDFTINAMAYSPKSGIIDFFGGQDDLKAGLIRCVGDADERFKEDALRIIRALRFASALGFTIERSTADSCIANKRLLSKIAVERISCELNKLITGQGVFHVLMNFIPVITKIIPEIAPMILFEQNSRYHCFDVFHHTVTSINFAPNDVIVRQALLFHDIAKPQCYTEDEHGGHFYGHPQMGAEITKEILLRLKYSNEAIESITELVLLHDEEICPTSKHIKRWLNRIGETRLRQLIEVKRADALAHTEKYGRIRVNTINDAELILNKIIEQQQCFSLRDLAINGNDLISFGVLPGVKIGSILNKLVDMVIDEKVENNKESLLKSVKELLYM